MAGEGEGGPTPGGHRCGVEGAPSTASSHLWTLHVPQGPQKPVWWRLGERPADLTWPVYSVGSSEITPCSHQPCRGGSLRGVPALSTGQGPDLGQAGTGQVQGRGWAPAMLGARVRAAIASSSRPVAQLCGTWRKLAVRSGGGVAMESEHSGRLGWAGQRRDLASPAPAGTWAEQPRLGAAPASPCPPVSFLRVPSSFRSAGRSPQPSLLALNPNSTLAALTVTLGELLNLPEPHSPHL